MRTAMKGNLGYFSFRSAPQQLQTMYPFLSLSRAQRGRENREENEWLRIGENGFGG